jgi:ArsR family metal-binding transcriptional regulator
MQKEAIEKDNAKTNGLDRVEATQSDIGKIKPNQNCKHVSPSKKATFGVLVNFVCI